MKSKDYFVYKLIITFKRLGNIYISKIEDIKLAITLNINIITYFLSIDLFFLTFLLTIIVSKLWENIILYIVRIQTTIILLFDEEIYITIPSKFPYTYM